MGSTEVGDSVTIGALAGQVRVARAFVGGLLITRHPCFDVAVLLPRRTLPADSGRSVAVPDQTRG
jgi:hypothetical protein